MSRPGGRKRGQRSRSRAENRDFSHQRATLRNQNRQECNGELVQQICVVFDSLRYLRNLNFFGEISTGFQTAKNCNVFSKISYDMYAGPMGSSVHNKSALQEGPGPPVRPTMHTILHQANLHMVSLKKHCNFSRFENPWKLSRKKLKYLKYLKESKKTQVC